MKRPWVLPGRVLNRRPGSGTRQHCGPEDVDREPGGPESPGSLHDSDTLVRLKAELFQMLGLWPVPERTPLHARVTGTLDREGPVVIETKLEDRQS